MVKLPELLIPREMPSRGELDHEAIWKATIKHRQVMKEVLSVVDARTAILAVASTYTQYQLRHLCSIYWPSWRPGEEHFRCLTHSRLAELVHHFVCESPSEFQFGDFMTEEELIRHDKAEDKREVRLVASDTRRTTSKSGSSLATSKSFQAFVASAAYEALRRLHILASHEDHDAHKALIVSRVTELWHANPHCNICAVPLTWRSNTKRVNDDHIMCTEDQLSVDAVVPRKHGGTYNPSSIQLLCVGCQYVKWRYDHERAVAIVSKLKNAQMQELRRVEVTEACAQAPGASSHANTEDTTPQQIFNSFVAAANSSNCTTTRSELLRSCPN